MSPIEFSWGGSSRAKSGPSFMGKAADKWGDKLADAVWDNVLGWVAMIVVFRFGGPFLVWATGLRSTPFPFVPTLLEPVTPFLPQRAAWIISTLAATHCALMWRSRKQPRHWYRRMGRSLAGTLATALDGGKGQAKGVTARLKEHAEARKDVGLVSGLAKLRDPQDRGVALDMLTDAVSRCQPTGLGAPRREDMRPRSVLKIEQGRIATTFTVRHSGVTGIGEAWTKLGGGLAAALPGKLGPNDVRVTEATDDAGIVYVSVTHSEPVKVEKPVITTGASILDGIDIAGTKDGRRIILPVYEQHWYISGSPRQGKSTALTGAAVQAAARRDCTVMTLDMQGAMSDLDPLSSAGYYDRFDDCAGAIRYVRRTLMEERSELLRKLGVRKLSPAQAPVLMLLADELPGILLRGGKELTQELMMILAEGPKLGICVVMATQQGKATRVPTELTSAALVTIGLRCRTPKESQNVIGDWHAAGYRLNALRGPGQAIIISPNEDDPIRCQIHDLPDGLEVRPSDPDDGPDDDASDPVSDDVSEAPDTAGDLPLEDDALERASDVSDGPTPPRPERLRRIADRLTQAGEWGLTATELADMTALKRPTIIADIARWDGPGEVVQGTDKRYRLTGVASEHTVDA